MEEAFSNVLNKLKWEFIEKGDNAKRIYIENVMKIRSQVKAYAIVKNAYYKQQSEYDLGKSEEFIHEHPFSNTDKGIEILYKLDNISKKILGCRNNIIQYAYNLFEINGYDMVALEKLTSSQFEKVKTFPTMNSLLKYHKILGCTQEEMEQKDIYSVIKKGYYDIIFNDNVVSDAKLSTKGELSKFKDDFFNLMIKSIHFADIKDYFITLSNNGAVGVSLVPSYFTSQMDSRDHKIYAQYNKSGKMTLADKHKVRNSQEKHINGLNADYNAAKNIAYIMEDTTYRDMFMKQSRTDKSLYNKPSYETFVKTQGSVVAKLKKTGMIKLLA